MQMQSKQIDELIRGEMAAVKSYETVLAKIDNETEKQKLMSFKNDHQMALEKLKTFSPNVDASSTKAGPWTTFATAFAGGASFFGDKAAIKALQVGEQHGLNEYQEAIIDQGVSPEVKAVIRAELLPNQEKHISMIRGLVG